MSATTLNPPRHLGYLDAARGIAAFMVLIYHYVEWKYPERTIVKLSAIVFNGADAVSFFFVLSGMVLTYKYITLGQPLDIRKFYINRFLRLFPAFFLAVLLNTLYSHRNELDVPHLVDIFLKNKNEFWEEAALIRDHPNYFGPSWTLSVELAISFFIPFLVVLAKANRKLMGWLILVLLLAMQVFNQFMIHFVLGIVVSAWFAEISDPEFRKTKWYKYRYGILLIGAVLFSIRHIDRLSPLGPSLKYLLGYLKYDLFLFTGIGSFIFLVWMVHSQRVQQVLSHRFLLFLGKISYGIYLMHWLVVIVIYDHWDQLMQHFPSYKMGFLVMLAVCAAVTIGLATIVHYTIELPFIRLGKRITGRMKPSLVIP